MKRKRPLMNVGWSLIMLVFVSLLLTTFSALSVVSAKSQLDISKKISTSVTDYYKADSNANKTLMNIDKILYNVENEVNKLQTEDVNGTYNSLVYDKLKDNNNYNVTFKDGVCQIAYDECTGYNKIISVVLSLKDYKSKKDDRYKIISWITVNNKEINVQNNINIVEEDDLVFFGE